MKVILTNYGDISDVVQKDDILFLVSQLSENQEISEEFSIRIADPDGNIETFLTQYGVHASIQVYDDQNTLISTYYFTGRYERTQDFYFIDAFFRKEIIPADAVAGRTGFFDLNLLFSRVFGASRQDILLPGDTNYAYLNIYDTISEIPVSGYSGVSMTTYGDYVFIAHQNILIRYQKSTKTYQAFTIPQYSPSSGYTKPSCQVYFSQSSAPIQAKILGFRVESGIPYIYILTDEIYYLATGALAGFYTVRKFRADFTTNPSYITVKEKLFSSNYAVDITFAMLCDLSTVIPIGVQSSTGNFDYLVWLRVKKDTSSQTASRIWVYLMDLNFNPGSYVAEIVADFRSFNQDLRRYSDSYFYDSTKWAVVWNCLMVVKWGSSYHAHQIDDNGTKVANCSDCVIFYDASQSRFRAYIEYASGKVKEILFNGSTFSASDVGGYLIGGRNSRISWLFSQSSAYEFLETQLGGQKSMPHVGLNTFDLGYIYSDAFIGFIDSYAVVGFIQSQPNISVFVEDATTKVLSIVGELKKVFSDVIIYDADTKQFYSTSSRAPSGTITQDDYSQYREEAFTRKNMSCLVTFADGYTGRLPYEEKTLELSTMYAFQGWHLFSAFTRWKKYEILSPRSDLSVGLVYTFTDQEGRSVSALVKKKLLEFSGLWRYELVTLEYPTTIEYELPQDEPSWLVLDTDFSHGLTEYGTHFEHLAKISWRSLGVEPPLRVYITVIDTYTGDVVVDEWSFISRSGTYYVRWTASKLTNYTVTARFVSAHDVDEYSWNITYLTEAEPKKSAVLLDIANFKRNPIFYNPNAHFTDGMAHWETNSRNRPLSPGEYLMTADYYPAIYLEKIFTNIYVNLWAEPNGRVELFVRLYDENYNELYEETIPITEDITGWPVDIWKSYSRDIYTTEPIKYYRVGIRNISTETEYAGVYVGTFGLFYYTWANDSQNSDTVDGRHASDFAILDANNTFTGVNLFKPSQDSTTAFRIQKSNGSAIFNIDTTNRRVGIGTEGPGATLDIIPSDTTITPLKVKSNKSLASTGNEIVSNYNFSDDSVWNWGSGWQWNSNGYAEHISDGTSPLSQNINITNGVFYYVEFYLYRTAGSITIKVDGEIIYNYGIYTTYNLTGTYRRSFLASRTASVLLEIIPSNDFRGYIDYISIKPIVSYAQPFAVFSDENNQTAIKIGGIYNKANLAITSNGFPYIISGTNNTAVGINVLNSLVTGGSNVAIGTNIMPNAINASLNIGIGDLSLRNLSTGSSNIAIGNESLFSLTSGMYNVSIGPYSLRQLTSGYYNVAIGANAGRYTTSGGSNETPKYSTYIGISTRAGGSNNEIVIGYDTYGAGSNTVTLGNNNITATYLKGKTGINYTFTTSPPSLHSTLQVNGSVAFPITTTDSNLTLTDAHYTVLVDAFDSNVTITLPDASGIDGRIYVVKRIDNRTTYSVTIQATNQTIDGVSSISLSSQYATVMLQAYGGKWYILSKMGV